MNKTTKPTEKIPVKKPYKRPVLKQYGSVKNITLKAGSAVDGFGTFG